MQTLEAEFERARRYRTPLTVAMLDLDHFKQINDRFGHAAGDEVLVLFAKAAAHSLRKTDLFGRVGLRLEPAGERLIVSRRGGSGRRAPTGGSSKRCGGR